MKNCTDYDGMGNQGRFPKTKEIKKEVKIDSVMVFLIFLLLIPLFYIHGSVYSFNSFFICSSSIARISSR